MPGPLNPFLSNSFAVGISRGTVLQAFKLPASISFNYLLISDSLSFAIAYYVVDLQISNFAGVGI